MASLALQHVTRPGITGVAIPWSVQISSPAVDRLAQIRRLLRGSSDPENPGAEELMELMDDVQHIAVVGLSRNLEKAARRVPSYLAAKGYDVIPVNPFASRLLGRTSYSALADVPAPVDLVLVFRPSEVAGPFVEEAHARSDEPAIWLQTGVRSEDEITAARNAGRIAVQDLCIFRVHRALIG